MRFTRVDPKKSDDRQEASLHGEAVSAEADAFLIIEELFGIQYVMKVFFVIALPVLAFFTVYNLMVSRFVEAVLVSSMWCLLLYFYFAMGKSQFRDKEKQYRIYQNVIRAFLFIFIVYIGYAAGWKNELDRLQWSYIFPIVACLCLGRIEGFCWAVFFLASMILILFYPHPGALFPDTFLGFKFRYILSFSILCAFGIAWKYGIDIAYAHLVHKQCQQAESEKQYRKAYKTLHQEMGERRLAQQTLRESEEKYKSLTENMNDILWTTDLEMNITYLSPSIEKVLKFTVEERMKHTLAEQMPSDSLKLAAEMLTEELQYDKERDPDRHICLDLDYFHKDGSVRCMETSLSFIRDESGKPVGIHGLSRDVTDYKRAENALKESKARYSFLAEHMTEAVWLMDTNFKIAYLSPSLERMRGYTLEEIEQLPLDKHLTPKSLELALDVFSDEKAKVLVNPTYTPMRTLELEFFNKDGTTFWSECTFTLIRDKNGNPESILGEGRDITARKQAEEEKRILEERLQQADKMEAIGTLAGGIAHDFNNLLMGIQGYASMTLLNLDIANPNYERLKRIEEQVQSGADLTSQLLGFARGGRYEVKPSNINEIIEKTSSLFGRTKKEISLKRKLAKDIWNVEADRGQIEQVFLNMYVNAWQAMPGGGNIYMETRNVVLDDEQALFCSLKPGKHVKITITDTGTGMDEKTKERIFDPFFTTKEMGRGTGLGLATVYGIIKGHHGMIHVDSVAGQGATFTIFLPATDKEISKEKAPIEEIITGTETILLVDDEQMVMEVNQELLESMGYTVYAASSGQEGIALYTEKKEKIDLVILDMVMPGISGSETFDRLRKINPKVNVLLSSGYSLTGEAQSIMDRGCNGFLQKPFKLEELSGKVREMLG